MNYLGFNCILNDSYSRGLSYSTSSVRDIQHSLTYIQSEHKRNSTTDLLCYINTGAVPYHTVHNITIIKI